MIFSNTLERLKFNLINLTNELLKDELYAVMKDFHQTLVLNFHMNLDFGTKRGDKEKRINNEDKDNGILSGAK